MRAGAEAAENALGFAAADDEEIGIGGVEIGENGVVDVVSGDDFDGFRYEGFGGESGVFLAAVLGLHLPFNIGEAGGEAEGGEGVNDAQRGAEAGGEFAGGGENAGRGGAEIHGTNDGTGEPRVGGQVGGVGGGEDGAFGIVQNAGGDGAQEKFAISSAPVSGHDDEAGGG